MTASSGSYGSGATHTVWVAPTQGVLRYVPFAVNASVGDTVKFIWGANNHTVTKSSELELCNKTGDAPFASGEQNKTFVCKYNKHPFSWLVTKLTTVLV
jgi:plastocyanin